MFPRGYWVHVTGGATYFGGLETYTLGIFLGQEISNLFFQVLKKYAYLLGSHLKANFSLRLVDQNKIHSSFFQQPVISGKNF